MVKMVLDLGSLCSDLPISSLATELVTPTDLALHRTSSLRASPITLAARIGSVQSNKQSHVPACSLLVTITLG